MADGVKSAMQNIGEAIVKPVVDEVGKAIETGIQSVLNEPVLSSGNRPPSGQQPTTSTLDPAIQQQTQAQEQTGLTDARRKIKYWQDLASAQSKIREDQKKKEQERLQEDPQKKKIKQFEIQEKKKENIALQQAKTKTEVRKGVGG